MVLHENMFPRNISKLLSFDARSSPDTGSWPDRRLISRMMVRDSSMSCDRSSYSPVNWLNDKSSAGIRRMSTGIVPLSWLWDSDTSPSCEYRGSDGATSPVNPFPVRCSVLRFRMAHTHNGTLPPTVLNRATPDRGTVTLLEHPSAARSPFSDNTSIRGELQRLGGSAPSKQFTESDTVMSNGSRNISAGSDPDRRLLEMSMVVSTSCAEWLNLPSNCPVSKLFCKSRVSNLLIFDICTGSDPSKALSCSQTSPMLYS
mmetsp:Transcript_11835/g.21934  ORF Transcript_11835/g.21934 Transcript_11835/m.21934 type:complete len:258 (-) Transcript_11835:302-1075(-)